MRSREEYLEYRKEYYLKNRGKFLQKNRERKARMKKPCPICGELMSGEAQCCRICRNKSMRGKPSGAWKGGRVKHSAGYIMIYKPEYPRANKQGYVLEHVLIWEMTNNKSLPLGWHIHHLNGIKDDNRTVNLLGLPSHKHALILAVKSKRIQELEAIIHNQHQLL